MRFHFLLFRRMTSCNFQGTYAIAHGLRTPNQDINQRNLKIWADERQNMLWPYLKIWEWELIFGRAVKAISSPGVRSPCP